MALPASSGRDGGRAWPRRERSAGVVAARPGPTAQEFLLVKSGRWGHWGVPKGHVEAGESPRQAAARELHEETGLRVARWVDGFEAALGYTFAVPDGARVEKTVHLFLAEVTGGEPRRSAEHPQATWADLDRAAALGVHADLLGALQAAGRLADALGGA